MISGTTVGKQFVGVLRMLFRFFVEEAKGIVWLIHNILYRLENRVRKFKILGFFRNGQVTFDGVLFFNILQKLNGIIERVFWLQGENGMHQVCQNGLKLMLLYIVLDFLAIVIHCN